MDAQSCFDAMLRDTNAAERHYETIIGLVQDGTTSWNELGFTKQKLGEQLRQSKVKMSA